MSRGANHETSGRWTPATILWTVLLAAYLLLLTEACFRAWRPQAFFGDDLYSYWKWKTGAGFPQTPAQAIFTSFEQKYRPVFFLAMEAVFKLSGGDVRAFTRIDVLLNALSGLLVAQAAFRLSRSRVVAVAAATMATASRFLLYQVTQPNVLENVGYLLFLAMLIAVGKADSSERDKSRGPVLAVLALEWLLILDHERYVAVTPWVAFVLWMLPARRPLPFFTRAWPPLAAMGAAAYELGYKGLALRQPVMLGTSGAAIHPDAKSILDHAGQAALSLISINHGPGFLVGRDMLADPGWIALAAAAFIALFAALLLWAVARPEQGSAPSAGGLRSLTTPLSFAVLAALLLGPPMATIRMEQRWLVEPFALLVLTGAWAVGRLGEARRRSAALVFTGLAAASVIVDVSLQSGFPQIFYVHSSRDAQAVRRLVETLPPKSPTVLVATIDACSWAIQESLLVDLYAPRHDPIPCVTGFDQIGATPASGLKIYRVVPGTGETHEITDFAFSELAYRNHETPRVDFVDRFPTGKINDERNPGTPTSKGALPFNLEIEGVSMAGMAVVAGFTYRFDHVPVGPNDALRFDVAMALPAKDSASATVTVIGADGRSLQVYSGLVPIWAGAKRPRTPVSARVGGLGPDVSVIFTADTPKGADGTAQWVEFVRPRIVTPKGGQDGSAS